MDTSEYAPDLGRLKRMFSEARDLTAEARRRSETCFDYYDNRQLSAAHIKALRDRKQPEIWINRIAPAINGVLGVLEQGQSDPRAFPRNGEDQDSSEVATDALRYAADKARWQRVKLASAKNYLIGGTAAVIVEVDDDSDPKPKIIRWNEFFYDPYSRDPDYEDARYMGCAKWMYVDEIKAMYPKAEVDLENIPTANLLGDQQDDDRPEGGHWGDVKKRRALIAEMYCDDGGWKRVVFYGGGVLESGSSPYTDEKGRPTNPIVAQSAHVDRDNSRYGIVWAMTPVQDEINMRRSRLLHMANSRQVQIGENGTDTDADTIRKEAARADGILPTGVTIVPMTDLAAGQSQLLAESKNEIERMGPNPAVLGRQNADASGRAQLIRQQAGLIELTPVLGGIEDFELRVYRQMWARIKQFWNEPKFIRVTDDIGAAKFLQVNEPVVTGRQIVAGPDGMPTIQPIVEYRNRPSEMDMDIIIDSTPDTANVQSEQFAELVKLAGIYGPQEVPFEDLLEASSLPKKRALIEKRQARQQEAQAAQQQGAGPQQQMAQAAFEADMQDKAAKTALNAAKAEQTSFETQIAAFQAGSQLGAMMPAAGV